MRMFATTYETPLVERTAGAFEAHRYPLGVRQRTASVAGRRWHAREFIHDFLVAESQISHVDHEVVHRLMPWISVPLGIEANQRSVNRYSFPICGKSGIVSTCLRRAESPRRSVNWRGYLENRGARRPASGRG